MSEAKRLTIGIIGVGFVGRAVAHGFSGPHDVRCYDVDPLRSTHRLVEVLASDVIFLCLPTPMSPDGSADISAVEKVCAETLAGMDKPIVLKSTVPPGTTDMLGTKYNLPGLIHNPEFLSARTALVDFLTPARTILGTQRRTMDTWEPAVSDAYRAVFDLFATRFPGVPILSMFARESETVKYICNVYGATCISFFNEMKLIVDKLDCNWADVMEGVMSSGRVPHIYSTVTPEGGYGGACFAKDINAMIHVAELLGVDPKVLKAGWAQNLAVRKVRDWETNPSATNQTKAA